MWNLLIILFLVILGSFLLYLTFRKGDVQHRREEPEHTQEYLVERVKESFHEILTTNISALYLNETETKKKERLKEQLRRALRTCSYGDIRAKEYVKEHIRDILVNDCGIGEKTIHSYFPYSGGEQSVADRFDILLYLYKKEWKYDALSELIKRLSVTDRSRESLVVSAETLDRVYEMESPDLTYGDKLAILVQRIYQIYKGNGVVDEIRDMNIDGVSAGVSGISDTFFDAKIFTDQKTIEALPKSYDSVWIFYQGQSIHLSFLGFGSKNELERVCKNIYRYDNPGQLSAAKGYIANEMQDGSRVIVVRPPFSESWAFFVRKFNSVGNLDLEQLITGNGSTDVIGLLKGLIKGCQVIGITGEQGSGKTTLLKALIRFVDPAYTLRIQELIFELNLRKIYPERNILTFKETASVSGQEGLDIQKKTDGTVTILGEVATAPVASWLVQVSQTASRFTMFTHHAKTTRSLIEALRNSLLLAGGFSNEQIAEEQVAGAVNFDIHVVKNIQGKRYIERVTEIGFQDPKPIFGLSGIETRRGISMTDLVVYDPETEEYKIMNSPSERALKELYGYMTVEERMEFGAIFDRYGVRLYEVG